MPLMLNYQTDFQVPEDIIFLKGTNGKTCPIAWSAKKIRRVLKSTLAAEALSLVEGLDVCYFVRSIIREMFQVKDIVIKCFNDNKSLSKHSLHKIYLREASVDGLG